MSKERVPFIETMSYPVIFMIMVSLIFVGILAVLFRFSENRIETYKRESYQKLVLELCASSISKATGISAADITSRYPQSYDQYITKSPLKGEERDSWAVSINDSVIVRCVDIPGKGLWGSMRGLVSVSPDLTQIRDLAIYEQMETPGLGARIAEEWFQAQFRYRTVITDGKFMDLELIPEAQAANPNQVNQVTGATITSAAVLNMLSTELQKLHDQNHPGGQR